MQSLYSALARTFWYILVCAVIALATYSAGMRALLAELHRVEQQVVTFLSETADAEVSLGALSGGLRGFSPHFTLRQLSVMPRGTDINPLILEQVDIEFDIWASLLARDIRFSRLHVAGLQLTLDANRSQPSESNVAPLAFASLVQQAETIWVSDAGVMVVLDEERRVSFEGSGKLLRTGSERQLRLRLRGDEGSHLSLAGSGVGDILDTKSFQGELHGRFSSPDMQPLLALVGIEGSGAGDVGFWYHVTGEGPALTSSVTARNVALRLNQEQWLRLDRFSSAALARPSASGWTLQIQDFQAAVGEHQFGLARASIDARGSAVRLRTSQFDVTPLGAVIQHSGLLPSQVNAVVAALAPEGHIDGVELTVADYREPLADWSVSAQAVDLTTRAFKGVPGLGGIDASFEADHKGATAWIDTRDFSLDIPRTYQQPLLFRSVRGRLSAHWSASLLTLEQGLLTVTANDHDAMVQFAMDIPLKRSLYPDTELAMYLSVGFGAAPLTIRDRYLPLTVSPPLSRWLDMSIRSGDVEGGAFLWRGGFKDYGQAKQSLQLGLEIQSLELAFNPEWPALTASSAAVLVDTQRVSAWSQHARVADLQLQGLSVEVDASRSVNTLLATSRVEADASSVVTTLRQSPVYERAYSVLSDVIAQGSITGELTVGIDLSNRDLSPQVKVDSYLQDVTLTSDRLQLGLEQMMGPLAYDTEHGFQSPSIEGRILTQPFNMVIGRNLSGADGADVLDARLTTRLSADTFTPWLKKLTQDDSDQILMPLEGSCDIELAVGAGSMTSVRIGTDLQGLAINLPSPLGKTLAAKTPFTASLELAQKNRLEVFWRERLNALAQGDSHVLEQVSIDLTPTTEPRSVTPLGDGLHVTGRLPSIDLQPWLDTPLVRSLSAELLSSEALTSEGLSGEDQPSMAVFVDALQIDQLSLGTRPIGKTEVNAERFEGWDGWRMTTPWLDAALTLPNKGDPTLIINEIDFDQLPAETDDDAGDAWSPPRLPRPLTVVVANMRLGEEYLGAVRFDLNSDGQLLRLTELSGNLIDIDLLEGTQLDWHATDDDKALTTLVLNAELDNVSRTFSILGQEPVAETDNGRLAAVLRWPGSPMDIDVRTMMGEMDLTLREGSFLPVPSGATGAVRLLSLLNLAGLFERANVTRLFEPGVAFKKAEGKLLFNTGQLALPGFSVEGPGGGFKFTSDIDLLARSIDGELVVTLPLAKNIPWVAALAGGLPVAAGAYIASRVFKDQVKTLTSGVYSVSGSVDEPTVKFLRVFDATGTKQTQSGVTESSSQGPETDSQPAADLQPATSEAPPSP